MLCMDALETGRRVRAGRAYAGISQRLLAENLGVSQPTMGRIESGERLPRKWELFAIAQICQLPMLWFEGDLPTDLNPSAETVAATKKPPNAQEGE